MSGLNILFGRGTRSEMSTSQIRLQDHPDS
jgi:hypothetical protein